MNKNQDKYEPSDDEAWIDVALEPLKAAAQAPVYIASIYEPSEAFLNRCRQSAMQAWSLHRLKAEVQQTPAEAVGLTQWLNRLAEQAGLKLSDAIAHFTADTSLAFRQWPAATLGAFLRALGLDPHQTRIQLGLDCFLETESDLAAAMAHRRTAGLHSHPPRMDFAAADEFVTRACSASPRADQTKFNRWLDDVTKAMGTSAHETP